jgi:hypothetical protein
LAGLVVLVTACGGGGDDGADSAATTAEAQSSTGTGGETKEVDTTATRRSTTTVPAETTTTEVASGERHWTRLRSGDCVTGLPASGTVSSVSLVGCSEEHEAEVFHTGQLSATDIVLRGPESADAQASAACDKALPRYLGSGVDAASLNVTYLVAEETANPGGTSQGLPQPSFGRYFFVCLASNGTGPTLTGSIAA